MPAVSYVPDQPAARVHTSLRRSLKAMEKAQKCTVLWFAEVMRRHLYRDLGHSSINQYAMQELGFSRSRTRDFIRLAGQLDKLPAVREAMTSGELGYTKARELVLVATPETEDTWLKAARGTRKELVREVKKAKRAAKVDPAQGELMPTPAPVVAPKELPVRFQMDLTPEQEARRAALVERLHKLGTVPNDKAELMLEALAALVESREKGPRGPLTSRPPVQIHVHDNEGIMTVQTDAGERELSRAEAERMRCDAAVCHKGGRNKKTIPPRIRREVLARDQHRCLAPGCGRTRFLEVHHLVPRKHGGTNQPENLTTLCSSCHRLWYEKGGRAAQPVWEKIQSRR
jgi:5-methylcytosine-specific restriction endonuclease McrA